MLRKRTVFAAFAALALPLAFASNAGAMSGECQGRNSPLNPAWCTYCTWGSSCGACTIKGCDTQLMPGGGD